jgi:hypothetical protein
MKNKIVLVALMTFVNLSAAFGGTVIQTTQFDRVTPQRLYQAYLSSAEHSAFTGYPANIDPRVGGVIDAFQNVPVQGAYGVRGIILQLDPGTHSSDVYLIVQSWRGFHDNPADLDSTLTLTFRKNESGAEIELVQVNVPDAIQALVNTSWNLRYWNPLRTYLQTH